MFTSCSGDYNTSADRHLGAAATVSRLRPDLLISESTYGTTIRDSKKSREREFLSEVRSGLKTALDIDQVWMPQDKSTYLHSAAFTEILFILKNSP